MIVALRAQCVEALDRLYTQLRYYKNARFKEADRALAKAYRRLSPYRAARKEGVLYGETPLFTLEQIGDAAGVTPSSFLVDFGCGRGRSLLFFRYIFGCRVAGVEMIEAFVSRSRPIVGSIEQGDLTTASLDPAVTHVYIYSTCLSDELLASLTFPPHVTIITVSGPMPGYAYRSFSALFPWGRGDIYINYGRVPAKEMPPMRKRDAAIERGGAQGACCPARQHVGCH